MVDRFIDALKQPSTVKGLLGLAALVGLRISPDDFQTAIEGIGAIYFLIAIFWQRS